MPLASRFSRPRFILAAILSVLVAVSSFRFLLLPMAEAFPGMLGHLAERQTAFYGHVVASPIALAAGALQFWPRLRARRPALHRWTGRIYAVAILIGGVSGMALAFRAEGGPIAGWGFGVLSVLWLVFTAQAVRLAMAGRYAEHRTWMIRSFALTFAAATLRLQLGIAFAAGADYAPTSQWLAWTAWVPNLIFAEWLIRRPLRRRAVQPTA